MSALQHRRRRLQQAADGLWPYGRDLTDVEAASGVSVPDLDHAQQSTEEALTAAWMPLRRRHVDGIVATIRDVVAASAPGDTSWIGSLRPAVGDSTGMQAAMLEGIDTGRALAISEAARQSRTVAARATAAPRPDHTARVALYVAGAERLLSGGLLQSATREAFRLTTTDVDVAAYVLAILGELPMLYERDILGGMATGAVNEGRYEVVAAILGGRSPLEAAQPHPITGLTPSPTAPIYALEILDGNTCEECAAIDGQRYDTIADARVDYPGIGGGYVHCLGRDRCRGSLVFVFDEATPPTGGTGIVEPPPPRPKPPPSPTPPPTPPVPPPAPTAPPTAPVVPPAPGPSGLIPFDNLASTPELLATVRANGAVVHATFLRRYAEWEASVNQVDRLLYGSHIRPTILRATLQEHGIVMAESGDLNIQAGIVNAGAPPLGDLMHDAGALYPADWVEASNRLGATTYNDLGWNQRAYYDPGNPNVFGSPKAINLESDTTLDVAAHELAHRMEDVIGIRRRLSMMEQQWLLERAPGEAATTIPGYGSREVFVLDQLPDPYTGRIYSPTRDAAVLEQFYEVLSTGMQSLAGRQGNTARDTMRDHDHIQFVLGLLATIRP